ncbi:MAG: two-component system, OmpR family, alkaline phosphatase synthesis response regulator PhoP [Actinomycetota bacterium]|nr:two-component system, OmpR family, alkaline phosphatase synthesis response regulator PhoP [Actinomycetota bacterium]
MIEAERVPYEPLQVGKLQVQPEEFLAFYEGRELKLTYKEFKLLELFASFPGRLLTRDFIATNAWAGDAPGRSVDISVSRIRKHLPPGAIKTIVRVGYRLTLE